jgi:hypothetical protein
MYGLLAAGCLCTVNLGSTVTDTVHQLPTNASHRPRFANLRNLERNLPYYIFFFFTYATSSSSSPFDGDL